VPKLASGNRLAGWCSAVAGIRGRTVGYEVFIAVRSHRSPVAVLRELNLSAVHFLVQDLHKQPAHRITQQHLPLAENYPLLVKENIPHYKKILMVAIDASPSADNTQYIECRQVQVSPPKKVPCPQRDPDPTQYKVSGAHPSPYLNGIST